ncbi:MAG TPA: amidohydrolase family protein [Blastocatellia bacterium]|nr:amidohydrolase family protein [Blastocatellia bacterium]
MLLKNATCVTFDPQKVFKADLQIEGGKITAVAPAINAKNQKGNYDLKGRLLLPGFVCAHTHLYSALARGMPGPETPPTDFKQILEKVWWKLDAALDEPMIRASALVGAIEAVKAGTTTLIDHHSSPGFIRGSLSAIDNVLENVGLRRVVCYEITDRGGDLALHEMLKESNDFLETKRPPLSKAMVGAHAPFTLSDPTMERCGHLAAKFDCGVHIHLAEDGTDPYESQMYFSVLVTERLRRAGLLNSKSILAHCVGLGAVDRAAIIEAGAWMVHNPRSNMNNRVGRAQVEAFNKSATLGTDGIGADMLEELKTAYYRGHEETGSDATTYLRILANNHRLAAAIFDQPIGKIEVGAPADLIVLDYDSPTPLTSENLPWHVVFGWSSALIDSVMIGGKWIMRKRRFVSVDVERAYREAREQADRLWSKL